MTKSDLIRQALIAGGKSKYAIAKEFQVQPSMVYTISKNLENPKARKTAVTIDGVDYGSKSDAVRAFAKAHPEMTKYKIAKEFQVSYPFVHGALKRPGRVPIITSTAAVAAPVQQPKKKSVTKKEVAAPSKKVAKKAVPTHYEQSMDE